MKRKKGIRFCLLQWIGFCLLYVAVIVLYRFLTSYFLWLFLILLTILPVLSFLYAWKVSEKLKVNIQAGETEVEQGKQVCLAVRWDCPGWCNLLDANLKLSLKNVFEETSSECFLSMPVSFVWEKILHREKYEMQNGQPGEFLAYIQMTRLGRFEILSSQIVIKDWFGLFCIRKEIAVECFIHVFPEKHTQEDEEFAIYAGAATESEESSKKGNDFSEVSDYREYAPGDRLRDIHWKISARMDQLMVKERVAMSGNEVVLVPILSAKSEETEKILKKTASLTDGIARLQTPVRLVFWNQKEYTFLEQNCREQGQWKNAYEQIYRYPMQNAVCEGVREKMKNCYPHLPGYIVIFFDGTELQTERIENV